MAEALDELAQDAAESLRRVGRDRPKNNNSILYGLSNGTGLIMVRVCILLMTIIIGLGATVGQLTLRAIDEKIGLVAAELKTVGARLDQMQGDVATLKIDDATTKQRLQDIGSGQGRRD